MYNSMWTDEKTLNERLIRDIDEYKTQYFRMRKKMDQNLADDTIKEMMRDYAYPGIAPPQRTVFYGGGYKTKDEKAAKNGFSVTVYPLTKQRPKSQEILRSKDTNVALINLAFPTRLAIKEA
ncbi:hypothetical protein BV898_01680 [Hypsibius exemplaris]|nr:hypothetical protein BV898_01680 [Hypsibius exemplaris]